MKQILLWLRDGINALNERAGRLASWFTLLLAILICTDVFMRYGLNVTKIWVLDLKVYLFSLIFLLGGAYTLLHDRHVRVDVFYANWPPRRKAWADLLGGLLLLLPWCAVVVQVAWHYAYASYQINESSEQTGGLPALYVLKFCMFVGFGLLTLQAISSIASALLVLLGEAETPHQQ
jgi:TRAP-type mannitol/chloroaromatic compound transport system permease small subunit